MYVQKMCCCCILARSTIWRSLSRLAEKLITAWELLAGETADLQELAELVYDEYSVRSAWAAWLLVADGLYFSGTPENIVVRTAEEVAAEKANRLAKEAEQQAWDDFLRRAAAGETAPEDARYIQDIIALALEERKGSRVLQALGQAETAQNAHALLLKLGVWDITFDPYPSAGRAADNVRRGHARSFAGRTKTRSHPPASSGNRR